VTLKEDVATSPATEGSSRSSSTSSSAFTDSRAKPSKLVAIGSILADPQKNFSRFGIAEGPDHPEVKKIGESLDVIRYLVHPVGVREIDPILRPMSELEADPLGPKEYVFELVYGFRRLTAAKAKGWKEISAILWGRITDDEARTLNTHENTARGDPTDYELAHAFAMVERAKGWSHQETARMMCKPAPYVETMVRIVERCPREILDQWRMSPTSEFKRALDRISKINDGDPEITRRKMLDEWARFLSDRDAATPGNQARLPRGPRAMGRREIDAYRATVDLASEVRDSSGWRPLSGVEKETLHAVLRYIADPRATKTPLR
jgi:ParB-like chromosome segregation protein Spo0J